ncbi:MAG: sulfotransferase family protein [Acidimicrobiia bacterium]
MTLQVVGAGLGRTGTHSLKIALEGLLGAPCYHMLETFGRPDDIPVWHRAVNGDMPDWNDFLRGYAAAVDWPAGGFWREIWAANPDAVVLLSSRDTDSWWTSANNTIFQIVNLGIDDVVARAQMDMATDMLSKRFTENWRDETAAKRAFEQHNADVRASVPADRLIDYRPGDGWEPICDKLGLAVPDEQFPHLNTTDEFRAMVGMEPLA